MIVRSFAAGEWVEGTEAGKTLLSAVTGEPVAEIADGGLDYGAVLDHAREIGGPALRKLTFHQRALRLKELAKYLLERKEDFYQLSTATGATRTDSWIDIEGGIGTLFTYASKARRELPNSTVYIDGGPEPLSKNGTFIGQHVCLPLEGAAIHINAFNFPCWGMLEKLAPTLLAGVPAIVKPASQTAYLAALMFRNVVESEVLPRGSVQLIAGGVGDLMDHLTCQDAVAFTGSAATGLKLRQHPAVAANSVRFTMEADSLNCSVLGPEAVSGTEEFELFVSEVVREMTVKAGQKCTAIRRVIVPEESAGEAAEALCRRLQDIVVGNPDSEGVQMGPLVSAGQRDEVRARISELAAEAETIHGDPNAVSVRDADPDKGAFLSPTLLYCAKALGQTAVHEVEAFGPVSTIMTYTDTAQCVELMRRGRGSLVGSVFTADDNFARDVMLGAGPWHGRLLFGDRRCAMESTGHGSPLPALIHGGPGRAGGGEEMGGIRGVLHYMQRTALQGAPDRLTRLAGRWMPGSGRDETEQHPFRKTFDELELGDTLLTATRTVTLDDIEHFAEFTGDMFYAHMDEAAASANPFFDGRVAHGYFIVSAAAGLFVDPAPGPVLANYGLDGLRFMQPVYPGDILRVALTCKQKTVREDAPYGEVRWDTTVVNQDNQVVAQYDVLTLVARH